MLEQRGYLWIRQASHTIRLFQVERNSLPRGQRFHAPRVHFNKVRHPFANRLEVFVRAGEIRGFRFGFSLGALRLHALETLHYALFGLAKNCLRVNLLGRLGAGLRALPGLETLSL